jgi:O-antigen/teichoic acid export membrane protein
MAASARAIIVGLLGEKWAPCILYLQLLCIASMFYPLHSLNLNILKVEGRSDLFLKLEFVKKTFAVPTIVIGVSFGMIPMLIMIVVFSIVSFFINTYYSGHLIAYSTLEQIRDIVPSFIYSLMIAIPVYLSGLILKTDPIILLLIQGVISIIGATAVGLISEYEGVTEVRDVIEDRFKTLRNRLRTKEDDVGPSDEEY